MMLTGKTSSGSLANGTASAINTPVTGTEQTLSWWRLFYSHLTANGTTVGGEVSGGPAQSNTTIATQILTAVKPTNYVPSRRIMKAIWKNFIGSDLPERIFKGQILTVAIVIGLLAVFLLREWIFQNAGPGPTQEVENEAIPTPEEFRMQMRAKWRQRRLRNLDHREAPLDAVFDRNHGRNHADFQAGRLRPRPALDRQQLAQLRAELIEHLADRQEVPDAMPTQDEEWVDEEDWVDDAETGGRLSDGGVEESSGHLKGEEDAKIRQNEQRYRQSDNAAEEAPLPSLLQQLRQQHREHADSNMSFEEFLAHSRSDITDPSGSVGGKPLRHSVRAESSTSPYFSEGDNTGAGRTSSGNRSPTGSYGETINPQGSMENDYHRYFTEPAGTQDDHVEHVDRHHVLIDNDRPRRAVREEAGQRRELERNPRPRRPRNVLNEAEIVVAAADVDEEVEMGPEPDLDDEEADEGGFMIDGDVDGILEAIGMRGPPAALFQNFLLICVVLNCGICIIVNVPFVIGKIHLIADIGFLGRVLKLPIMITRLITDPVIDGLVALGKICVRQLPSWMSFGGSGTAALNTAVAEVAEELAETSTRSYLNGMITAFDQWPRQMIAKLESMNSNGLLRALGLFLGGIGSTYRALSSNITAFALQDTAASRAVAISLGVFDIDLAFYIIAALGEQYLGSFGKTVAEHVDRSNVIVKLGFFMSVELLLFPLSMGYFLDFCTLPLFPSGTLHYRWIAQHRNPVISAFVHWLAGTMFMFAFARFLATCRSICRKGAMYVIRDPQDPSFSPVREILDKKTSVQIYKLLVSATMYISVMAIPLGGILSLLKYSGLPILPLRWSFRDSLIVAPVDLLILILAFPESVRRLKWQDAFKIVTRFCFKFLSETLRLSSYFRGIQIPEEEHAGKLETQLLHLHCKFSKMLSKLTHRESDDQFYEGTYMRVPYADQVILLKPRKNVFIPVDHLGIPKTDNDKVLWLMQDRAAIKGHRDPRKDYCMVYLPPFYRTRFWAFGLFLWTFISWTIVFALLVPILVGRIATHHFVGRDVHDGINLIAGFYICQFASRLGRRTGKKVASIGRRYLDTPRYRNPFSWKRYLIKEGDLLLRFGRHACAVFVLFVVSPVLLGLCLELYIFAPINYGKSDMTPVFHVFEAWSTGCVLMAFFFIEHPVRMRVLQVFTPLFVERIDLPEDGAAAHNDAQARVLADALRPENVHHILIPTLKYLLLASLAPTVIAGALALVLGLSSGQSAIVYRFIHPFLLYAVILCQVILEARRKVLQWSVSALESEYLVEQRVINFEDAEAGGGHDVKVFDPQLHAADVHHE
ncbi:hypothetical protein QFC22_000890 [Naganishia vaughanmartiniae]|uniref:Uncharacterized protein n=1 Tax=Naganishia vaughanmartiniae TaxID=1424756 RepID=A0ACC2XL36_9TREE|nr:hypothetical protein QFC22_000890 [Naganishia vaughanmartiniae]